MTSNSSNSRTPMYSEREHQLARVQGSKGNESVRFNSSMSVDELDEEYFEIAKKRIEEANQ